MKKTKKALLLVLCAILLVGATIAGTVAYLTDTDDVVTNTFTVGNVSITMVESKVDAYGAKLEGEAAGTTIENTYKLIPGHEYTKDPTITVDSGSEDCYIFVVIDNGLGEDAVLNMSANWANVSGNVWVYGTLANPVSVGADDDAIVPFDKFTFAEDADPNDHVTVEDGETVSAEITITAYAIQADGMDGKTAAEIWALF